MRPNQASRLLVLSLLLTGVLSVAGAQSVEKPAALVADGIPEVPTELAARTRPYMEFRTATFLGWHPTDRSMLIATRFGNTNQVHRVAKPGGARTQLSFEEDRVQIASHAPRTGDVTLVAKDVGGGEFYQLYTLANGRLSLLTDGKSRNQPGAWSKDGQFVGYSSTRRNGKDTDLYVMNPRDPKSDRLVAERKGGGWTLAEFSPDRSRAVVIERVSITHSNLWLVDLASSAMTPIGDHSKTIAHDSPRFAPDGTLWVISDEGSDFRRLGTLDPASGRFTPRSPEANWDVEMFDLADDGRFVAYVVNEAGRSTLELLDPKDGAVRTVPLAGRSHRRTRGGAVGRGRVHLHLGAQPRRRLLGGSGHARRHALDDQRDRAGSTRTPTSSPNSWK